MAHTKDHQRGEHSRLCLHLNAYVPTWSLITDSTLQQCQMALHSQFPQPFVSLIKTTIDISCLWGIKHSFSFFTLVLWSLCLRQQNLSNIGIKQEYVCWYSLPAKLEWCSFHCPPPSWRISFPVRLALKCFTLLLCVFSLFLLTPSTNCAQQSLGSITLAIGHL